MAKLKEFATIVEGYCPNEYVNMNELLEAAIVAAKKGSVLVAVDEQYCASRCAEH